MPRLRVITDRPIEEIDPARELARVRVPGEKSPIVDLIENAVRIACDHLVPRGIEKQFWKTLTGIDRSLPQGPGAGEPWRATGGRSRPRAWLRCRRYDALLASNRANEARLKTAGEFGRRDLGTLGFGSTLVRQCLFATHQTRESDGPTAGLTWLKDRENVPDYWASRERIIAVLEYLASLKHVATITHWHAESQAAELLAGADPQRPCVRAPKSIRLRGQVTDECEEMGFVEHFPLNRSFAWRNRLGCKRVQEGH